MKLKLTLRRPAGAVDLTVTADATATVADVARVRTVYFTVVAGSRK